MSCRTTAGPLWHADRRAELYAQVPPAPYADGQIAAIAATNGMVPVTRNVEDFRHFAGLQIENWFA